MLFYQLHLAGCEDAFVASVAEVGEGLEQATGFSDFLAEEVYGTLVAMVGVLEHGQAAEVALLAPWGARGAMGGVGCGFHSLRCSFDEN
jgi:hypothetical protein